MNGVVATVWCFQDVKHFLELCCATSITFPESLLCSYWNSFVVKAHCSVGARVLYVFICGLGLKGLIGEMRNSFLATHRQQISVFNVDECF